MPASQTAHIDTFDFGAPSTEAIIKDWAVRENEGGNVYIRFENAEGDADGTVTLQVSATATSGYADTTQAANLEAVADVVIPRKTFKDFTINLRAGQDKYLRLQASGGCRMTAQIRHGGILQDQSSSVTPVAVTWS
jgi:hypothetical protein